MDVVNVSSDGHDTTIVGPGPKPTKAAQRQKHIGRRGSGVIQQKRGRLTGAILLAHGTVETERSKSVMRADSARRDERPLARRDASSCERQRLECS
jgi:hypothetical protein